MPEKNNPAESHLSSNLIVIQACFLSLERDPVDLQELNNFEAGLCSGSRIRQSCTVPDRLKELRRVIGCEEVDGMNHDEDTAITFIPLLFTLFSALAHASHRTILWRGLLLP